MMRDEGQAKRAGLKTLAESLSTLFGVAEGFGALAHLENMLLMPIGWELVGAPSTTNESYGVGE